MHMAHLQIVCGFQKLKLSNPYAVSKEHHLVDSNLVLPTGNDLDSMMYSRIWLLFTVPAKCKVFG